jgi:hypothetical protein
MRALNIGWTEVYAAVSHVSAFNPQPPGFHFSVARRPFSVTFFERRAAGQRPQYYQP